MADHFSLPTPLAQPLLRLATPAPHPNRDTEARENTTILQCSILYLLSLRHNVAPITSDLCPKYYFYMKNWLLLVLGPVQYKLPDNMVAECINGESWDSLFTLQTAIVQGTGPPCRIHPLHTGIHQIRIHTAVTI